jgi:hypothetical protein
MLHVSKAPQPQKAVWVVQHAELPDYGHPSRFLRLDKFSIEELNQHVSLSCA